MNQEDVGAALNDLGIDASGLRSVPAEEAPEIVLAFDVERESWFATWQSLREAVGELALWPLATCTWGEPLEEIDRWEMRGPDRLDVTPSAIINRVPDVDSRGATPLAGSVATKRGSVSNPAASRVANSQYRDIMMS